MTRFNTLSRFALRLLLPTLVAASGAMAYAQADNWPSKPVRFVVPYPPGGLADSVARSLAEGLSERLKQTVIIDNKPGGSLIIGTDLVAKAPPDGYTILLGSSSSLAINASAFKKLPYDAQKDFTPVSLSFRTPLILMVSNAVPASNVKELIAHAKANPGALNYASLGHGSTLHLAGELFKSMADVDIVHIPYKGTTTAVPDLLTGRVSIMFDGGAMLPQAREGKVRMMAVTSAKRIPGMPDIPTMDEAGVPGYDLDLWFGVVAPAGTPATVVDRLARAIDEVQKQSSFRNRLTSFSQIHYETTSSSEMGAIIRRDTALWSKRLRDYNVEPE